MKIEYTRHATISAAKKNAPHLMHNPVIVELAGGGYDAFPQGHPLPEGSEIIIVTGLRANGQRFWKSLKRGVPAA